MTPYVRRLDDPACRDPREFGGKAAGLAALAGLGVAVPPGFVLGAAAYRAFLGSGDLRAAVDAGRPAAELARLAAVTPVPAAVADAVRDAYAALGGPSPVPVAVRSSATAEDGAAASFAGGFESWLDVTGPDAVVAHVHRCWQAVFAPRVGDYARAGGGHPAAIEMAVVVQRVVRARAAGVMFTVSPVTGDRSRIVVEASWGLGLAVVGGEVTPDRWVVDKVGLEIVGFEAGDKRIEYRHGGAATPVEPARRSVPCLTDGQVLALAGLGKRLERAQGAPQDVEFVVGEGADAGPVLVQCRPETVWSNRPRPPRFTGGDPAAWLGEAVGLLPGGPAR
ncbi:PEP/pyruvate-binding domain-containing protein [Micromonospora mangrovi]|uniref:Phosphoenolpyruvate synthase n=2 Tax=Micromonospora TaxID=1873 RepID=A0AAU7M7L6_9ACTN